MKALEPQKLHGLSLSARQLFNLVLVVGLGLGLSACNSLGLGSSSSAPATSETESGSSGFSFGNVLYGGSVPPSRPPEEEDIECPAPIYTAVDAIGPSLACYRLFPHSSTGSPAQAQWQQLLAARRVQIPVLQLGAQSCRFPTYPPKRALRCR